MVKNKKRFGMVQILVMVLVVGLIGGLMWHGWNNKSKDGKDSTVTTSTVNTTKSGYKLYEDSNVSLQYPDNWTQYRENNQPDWVFFKSPDYVPATELGPSVKAGYWLEIRVAKSGIYESYKEDLENAPTGQKNHGGTYETIKIDGHNAILSNTKTHGTFWYATTYYNGKTYFFRLNAIDEDKPEVKELFKSILETVRLR